MPSERGRPRGGGFLQVAQVDVDDDGDRTERRRLSGRERFRGTVQQVLRQTPFTALPNPNLPALSDGTLTDQDYLSLPIQQFDEVDLEDDRDRYAEVVGSYGPEAVDRNATLSHSFSTKAGKGIEVRVESYPLALSPGGLYTDDRLQDLSYRGSEEILNKPLPTSSILYNYRPVPLRRPFILILACSLIAFFTLSQLTLRLLPDASSMDEALPAFQNTTEIRKRSSLRNRDVENQRYFRHGNSTDTSVSTSASSPTESSSSTEVGSTSEVESQPTSPTLSSTTKTNTLTEVSSTVVSSSTAVPSSVADSSSTTEASSTTEVTASSSATGVEGQPTSSTLSSTVENNSSTEVSSTTEIGSSTEVGNQPTLSTQPSTTKSNNSTEPNPTTEPEGQPTSSIQPPATETTGISTGVQNSQPSTTNAQVTDVTPIGHGPSATNTISLTQPDEHNPTTGQDTANPPPNGPSPSGDSSSDEVWPPTQTAPDAVPADNDQNLPAPSPSQGNEAITVDSPHDTSGGQLSQPTALNFPLVPTRAGGQQVGDKVPSQTSTNPTDVNLLDLPYPSNIQSAGKSAGQLQGQLTGQAQDQTGDQQTEQNSDAIRKSSLTTDQAPSVAPVTSIQAPPSITSTITTTRDFLAAQSGTPQTKMNLSLPS
ncbi:hypothetical protein ANO14919_047270 [Xylariales sp. No.14919]|nr:hypothetical protein ANO14919_047270 [Xylariales sp. No.14919]